MPRQNNPDVAPVEEQDAIEAVIEELVSPLSRVRELLQMAVTEMPLIVTYTGVGSTVYGAHVREALDILNTEVFSGIE